MHVRIIIAKALARPRMFCAEVRSLEWSDDVKLVVIRCHSCCATILSMLDQYPVLF